MQRFLLLGEGSFLCAWLLVAAACWGALAGGAVGQETPQAGGGQPRATPDDQAAAAAEAAILRALEQPTALNFEETPLTEVAQFIAEKHKIPVLIDKRALADAGIDLQLPIRFALANVRLKNALHFMLRGHHLTWAVKNESLVITTQEVADVELRTEIHDLTEVLDAAGDVDRVLDIITRCVAPDSWQDLGGPGGIETVGNVLVVSNTSDVLEKTAQLLAVLAELRKQAAGEQALAPGHALKLGHSSTNDEIRRQLAIKVDAEFREEPLALVVSFFAEKLRVPTIIDHMALADAGIDDINLRITAAVKGVSARSALNLILDEHDLTWQIEHDALVITTKEVAETRLELRLYPLGKLGLLPSQGALLNAISSTVAPSSWQDAGGPGTMVFYRPCRCLAVLATPEVHDDVQLVVKRVLATIKTPPETDAHAMLLRVYLARPLPGGQQVPAEEAAKLVKQHVRPETWQVEVDPEQAKFLPPGLLWPHDKATIQAVGPLLLVRHTPEGQREVEKFLGLLGATPWEHPTEQEK